MANNSFVFKFADVEVHEREFRLVKAGEVLPVEPKAFRVLLFLLRNPQKLIPKEELLNAVWSDASVSENSLTRAIALLRRQLGDDVRELRYIATVTSVGYRFVCPVEVLEEVSGSAVLPEMLASLVAETPSASEAPAFAGSAEEPQDGNQKGGKLAERRGWLLPVAGLLAVGLAAAFWWLNRPRPQLRVSEYKQITQDGRHKGLYGYDGPRIYLNVYPDPQPVAQVGTAGGGVSRILLPLPNPWLFDTSPDGSTLLVSSSDGRHDSLWTVSVPGNSLRHLADGEVRIGAWSPDGKSVIYSTANGDIFLIRSDGTDGRKLGSLEFHSKTALRTRFSWSPDGSAIRFDKHNRIFEMSTDGTGLHAVMPDWQPSSWICCGRWTDDGKYFLFLSWEMPISDYPTHPPYQVWALDVRPRIFGSPSSEPMRLTSGPIRWGWPMPSKDGRKIFARGEISRGELVRYDQKSNQFQSFLGGISAEFVSFSPDGQDVAYVTFPEGILWKANLDGTHPVRLTDPPTYPSLPRWSRDGTQIAFFYGDADGHTRSYIIPSNGGAAHPLLPEGDGDQRNPFWSPDGHRIAFDTSSSTGANSKAVVRILDISNHKVETLPGNEWSPRWSPDGKFIAALSGDANGLTVFDLETQRWSLLHEVAVGNPTWSRDGQFIYFMRLTDDPGIYRIRPSGGAMERVTDLKGFRFTWGYEYWMGLDPLDAHLLLRDEGSDEIYALTLEEK